MNNANMKTIYRTEEGKKKILDLYDRQLMPLGRKYERDDQKRMPKGEFHIVVDILSKNSEGRFLITKRHPDKPYGGMWEISGGSVLAGEKPLDGAARELFEETGLKAQLVPGFRLDTVYSPFQGKVKRVTWFIANAENEIRIKPSEA